MTEDESTYLKKFYLNGGLRLTETSAKELHQLAVSSWLKSRIVRHVKKGRKDSAVNSFSENEVLFSSLIG